ncbi:hypothetical protein H4R18_000323 [Coemansia javaensis]|uniref:TH1 protein n=1 Tax=Coemansia javaensis TaxID=2761396 RepID=A0A9W8LMA9_9FUNG|nr:hypothetical protein H4R18_000323 [Coemansia javaensis]
MAEPANGTQPPPGEAERRKLAQEEAKRELGRQDAIMEPTTGAFVEQFLEAGGAPFSVMNLLMSSYEGIAALAAMVGRDMQGAFGPAKSDAILDTLGQKIVDSFDAQRADAEFAESGQLPEYIVAMIPHRVWRKTIYRLSAKHPASAMIGAALQRIADQGHQSEMTSLDTASLHTHVFYSLLLECFEQISPASGEDLRARMQELVGAVCQREQTYLVAQYVFRSVRQRLGSRAVGIQRIEQELESHMLDTYNRPQLAVHIQLLLNGFAVGGSDAVANAVASIIQSAYAAPGDVVALYNAYQAVLVDGRGAPPAHILRNERVLQPILEQAFGCLWSTAAQNQRPELVNKYVWLLAYAALSPSGPLDDDSKVKLQQLVAQMKEMREELPFHPIQTHLNRVIRKVLEWIQVPILARVVLLWIRDVLTFDSYTYYSMYFHSRDAPTPLLLLEEIAFRHPLLKPLVFAAYRESFESQVPGFPLEKQTRLQKVVINRIAVLVQLDYVLPVLDYFGARAEQTDESVMAYFIYRTLAQFDAPYPEAFAGPMLRLIESVIDGVKVSKPEELKPVRRFLASIDGDRASALYAALPQDAATTPS